MKIKVNYTVGVKSSQHVRKKQRTPLIVVNAYFWHVACSVLVWRYDEPEFIWTTS